MLKIDPSRLINKINKKINHRASLDLPSALPMAIIKVYLNQYFKPQRTMPMDNQPSNRFDNTLIACRVPMMLKEKIMEFSEERDVTVSQVMRLGIKMALGIEKTEKPAQWMVRR